MAYTSEQWQTLLEEEANSELCARDWCKSKGVTYGSYTYHKYTKPCKQRKKMISSNNGGLVKVNLSKPVHTSNNDGMKVTVGKVDIAVNNNDLSSLAKLINLINET